MAESSSASGRAASAVIPAAVRIAACVLGFLLIVNFGEAPHALGLDAAWTEVLAWGFLSGAQWGRDLVFTYGPLGFLQPYTSYVDGMFVWFVSGQVILSAVFASTLGLLLWRAPIALSMLFASAFVCVLPGLPGDLSWAFTLLFGTAWLLRRGDGPAIAWTAAATVFVPVFAAIALAKFSLLPLSALCVVLVAAAEMRSHRARRGVLLAGGYVLAIAIVWCLCGQRLQNLPVYLATSFEVASGFGHAMGNRAPFGIELLGVAVVVTFVSCCALIARANRRDASALAVVAMAGAAALLFWVAFFTRGDHWPLFYPAFALLPFVLLADGRLSLSRRPRGALVAVVVACAVLEPQVGDIPADVALRVDNAIHNLGHLPQLAALRREQWRTVGEEAALPQIRARVGNERVDMVTSEQGLVLLNAMNYAPRPVFQSYSAYTPRLARLNEAHFLGADAPEFVIFQLAYLDGRVPTMEDPLALVALLRRYRPVLGENGFLLLQRDAQAPAAALVEHAVTQPARMHRLVNLPETTGPTVAFLHIELTAFGRLYTLLFREPSLYLTRRTRDGEAVRQRLVRATAASGFLISPIIGSNDDWAKQYFSAPMREVRSIVVDAETKWERLIFRRKFKVAFEAVAPLTADPHSTTVPIGGIVPYPGFNLMPAGQTDYRLANEEGEDTVFLHAPAVVTFQPAPARYRVEATFGIQRRALADPGCIASKPDGIGVSIVLQHEGEATVLAHADIDPFHAAADAGPQRIAVDDVEVGAGDAVTYRVDVGPAGRNDHCDWSYVRDIVFDRLEQGAAGRPATAAGTDSPQHRR